MEGLDSPRLIIVAGPNGAGKSTLTLTLGLQHQEVIDPDAIARVENCSPVEAGRRALYRLRSFITSGKTCLQETTLSGRSLFGHVRHAKAAGFVFELHYIGLDDCRIAKDRVAGRAAQGGHDIPPEDICRRYSRGLRNLPDFLRLCDRGVLYDNSWPGTPFMVIANIGEAGLLPQDEKPASIPQWARRALREAGFA